MKKQFIILLSVCAVAMLAWVSPVFSWHEYSFVCGDCHGEGFAGGVHDTHSALDCFECHAEVGVWDSVATSNCAECHAPGGDPIECPLVIAHEASPAFDPEGPSCLDCHAADFSCAPECETDDDCDDGLFCTGVESCSSEGSLCVVGTDPCSTGICDETNDQCLECNENWQCGEGEGCDEGFCVEENPPTHLSGPWLAAWIWPQLATSESQAFTLRQSFDVLWTFDDDYATCEGEGLCTHRARYKRVDDTKWLYLKVETDTSGKWYASTELPVDRMVDGTYYFQFDLFDCAGQLTTSKTYYFKVAHP